MSRMGSRGRQANAACDLSAPTKQLLLFAIAIVWAIGLCTLGGAPARAQLPPGFVMARHPGPDEGSRTTPLRLTPPVKAPATKRSIKRSPAGKAALALTLPCTPPTAPNEIVELARALNWNPDLIYEYIHNNIQTLPFYDSLKGPLGALIDQAGTPQDQAELMYVLLQQSCYSPQYEVGKIYLTAAQLTNWLGTNTVNTDIRGVLNANGFNISLTYIYIGGGGAVVGADVNWVWVSVPIGGTSYQFDPASKTFMGNFGYATRSTGIASLGSTALGYSQSTFLSDAGGSGIGTPVVSGINRTNVRNDLTAYANNLVAYLKANNPTATTNDVIGGSVIAPLPPYTPPSGATKWGQTTLCNIVISSVCYPNKAQLTPSSSANLNSFRTTLALTLGYGSGGGFTALTGASTVTFNSSDIYGHRLAVQFDATTNYPTLLLDGAAQTSASQAVPTGNKLTVRVSIVHPDFTPGNVTNSDVIQVTPGLGAIYVIGTAWGGADRGMIEKHRKLMQQNTALNPGNPGAEPVLGEGLAMLGYSWLAEATRTQQRVQELTGATTNYIHAVGVIGMKTVGTSQGPFVDLPINMVTVIQRARGTTMSAPTPTETAAFTTDATMISVLESGAIEQTQPGASAASTTKVVDLWSQSGSILDINNPDISGDDCNYYKSTLRGMMSGYDTSTLQRIDSTVGYNASTNTCSLSGLVTRIIAPTNGAVVIDQWTGGVYYTLKYDCVLGSCSPGDITAIGAIISGGLSGGYPATPVTPPEIQFNQIGEQLAAFYSPPAQYAPSIMSYTNTNIAAAGGGSSWVQAKGGDPVNLVTGAYTYSNQDLSVGSGPYPDTLGFSRFYDSGLALSGRNSSLLGIGWMHNYDMAATPDSDGFEALGDNSPISGAASIAALYVVQDILNLHTNTLKPTDRMIIAAQAETWLTQQMTNNVATVALPGSVERFDLLPSGTYNAPPGSASVLAGSASAGYTYVSGAGTTLTFNPTSAAAPGKAASWSSAAGATVAFSYNSGGQLQAVCEPNCTSPARQLNFLYTGNSLTSVNDNTGSTPRTVSFGYDSLNNLTSVTDPLGATTTFAYAGVGQIAQIYYPAAPGNAFISMTYDTLGRPNQQADALGHVSTLLFAGTRTEIVDPAGTSRVSYFSPSGQTLATIDGLGSAGINSGAGNLTAYTLDGLNRVSTVTLPEGGKQTFSYDAYSKPTAIVSTPKPGSGLGNLTQAFTYVSPVAGAPNFEQVQTVTDPLGLVTAYGYDALGNRTSATADAGGSGHFNATSTFTYDSQGRVLSATDPLGTVARSAYDGLGNLTTVVQDYGRLNITTSLSYDGVGNAISTTDPRGAITTAAFDADRRPLSVTLPAASGPVLTTSRTYDANGQLLSTQQTVGGAVLASSSATYTLTGKAATATDANGNVTRFAYDVADRLTIVTDPAGSVTTYGYDALSRKISTSNLAIQSNPLVSQTYTGDGLVGSVLIARNNTPPGDTTSYTYDGFDRLSATTYPSGGGGATSETLAYDADGNVAKRVTRKGDAISFGYDTLNRLCTKTYASTAVACGGTSTNYLASFAYDLDGHLTTANDNGASVAAPSASNSFGLTAGYDPLNRPTALSWTPAATQTTPASSSSVSFTHTYDADNRRIGQAANDNSWMLYPSGAASTGYTANALNQYTAVGSASPTYDANGALTYDGQFTYCYDAESRLTAIVTGTCASPTTTVATYAYDAQGRRKTRTVGAAVTAYVTDTGNREVVEYNGTSCALQAWYAFGPGVDDVLNRMDVAGGTRATLIPDIQGSVIGQLASGGTLSKAAYLPFGENPSLTTAGYQYTGRRLDPETGGATAQPSGLYYYRARMYSPTWGRFLTADPALYAAGPNLYTYSSNSPLNLVDPLGLTADGPGGGSANIVLASNAQTWTAYGGLAGAVIVSGACDAASGGVCVAATPATIGAGTFLGAGLGYLFGSIADVISANNDAKPSAVPENVGPGPHAGPSVPAGPSARPTREQQGQINDAGAAGGCHTCGSTDPGTKSGNWVGDHQPPTSLNPPGEPQVYLPQCRGCSNVQGGRIRQIPKAN